jgi:hypothetical protein
MLNSFSFYFRCWAPNYTLHYILYIIYVKVNNLFESSYFLKKNLKILVFKYGSFIRHIYFGYINKMSDRVTEWKTLLLDSIV